MAILDFPPSELDGDYSIQEFTIGQRLIVRLTWQPGATATGVFFSLESCTGGGCSGFTQFATDLVAPYVDVTTGLAHFVDGYSRVLSPSTVYRFRVRNQFAGGFSTYSNTFEITLPAFTPPAVPAPGTDASPPLAPTALEASGTANQIDLTWQDNASNEQGFILQRHRVVPGSADLTFNWQSIASLAANDEDYSDTGLEYSTLYYYRIQAFNQYGTSAYSNIISYTTADLTVANLSTPGFTSATVEFVTDVPQVVLVWTDNSSTETAFLIERRVGTTGTFQLLFVAPANALTYTDTQVAAGGFYAYRIRAYRSSDTQYSPFSTTRAVTVGEIIFGGTLDGKARFFDGIDDRLDTGLSASKGSTNNMTCYAWVKKPDLGAGTVMGLINAGDADQRFDFHCQYSSVGGFFLALTFRGQNGNSNFRSIVTSTVNDPRNQPMFIAAQNDVAANRFRFFWGFTADSVVEVSQDDFTSSTDTSITFKQVSNSTVKIQLGALGRESPTNAQFFADPKTIDSAGIEFDTVLTLAELKDRARCGTGHQEHYWPITGLDPEENINAIHGTTVVDSICDVGPEDIELTPIGYGIAHEVPDGDAVVPSEGGVIRDNQMSNNAVANMTPNIYTLSGVTIDNPGSENIYIRRGVVLIED